MRPVVQTKRPAAASAGVRGAIIATAALACLTVALMSGGTSAQDGASVDSVVSALRGVSPNVSWDTRSIISADVTCDGRFDSVAVGYQGGAIWVGMVPGGKASGARRPVAIRFTIERDKPDGFCTTPVRLERQPLDCMTTAGPLPGCKAAPGCFSFSVTDDVCGPLHFHWDNDRNALSWSRR
jgi:hypothetical protein